MCVDAWEGHSTCLHGLSRIPSYSRVYNNNLRHTTGMANRDLIFCYVDARLPFGSKARCFVFFLFCAIL